MANIIRIKRRASGDPGAPASLENSELAYNEVDNILYYGKGTGGAGGSATVIDAIGGPGAMVTLTSAQNISGEKTFLANVAMSGNRITGVATPVNDTDAANKEYVDAARAGLDPKDSVIAATTENITLSGEQTIDGISLLDGDRVLVKDQTDATQNGIYIVSATAWSRSSDADSAETITPALFTFVESGTNYANSGWVLTTDGAITVGTTPLNFTKFSGAGMIDAGAGLTKTGDRLNVETASTDRIVISEDAIDLATTGISAGNYQLVTVDAYGRVTTGSNPTTLSGYGITDAQPLDDTLTALADITVSADDFIYATGPDAFATSTVSAYGRTLIDDADAMTARETLELGTISTQNSNDITITGGTINNVTMDGGTF